MTRKEFEVIKEQYCKGGSRSTRPNSSLIEIRNIRKLIQALENGGIEEEPDENDEPELIPCPFCDAGTSALVFKTPEDDDNHNQNQGHYVCSKKLGGCGASSGYCSEGDIETVKQRAADKWNTRATTPTAPHDNDKYDSYRILGEHIGTIIREILVDMLEKDLAKYNAKGA